MNTSTIRDIIIQGLKKEKGFGGMAIANMNGNYFSAADIAVLGGGGKNEIYRIAVLKHIPQKTF